MKKNLGILTLFLVVFAVTAALSHDGESYNFLTSYNLENLAQRVALYGIIGVGVAFVIITGGIDLSIGSLIGLVGTLLPWLLVDHGWSVPAAVFTVIALSAFLGLTHGLLITKLKLQPFIVTLCGLLFYRGLARWITGDAVQGFKRDYPGLRNLATGRLTIGEFDLPYPMILLIVLSIVAAIFLNKTIYGRYLQALGRNEEAARFSGINTDRMVILAYVICSFVSGLGGVLFALDSNSIQPAGFGDFYELYAIAAAVLGGCSLRGGEGSIFGVVIGAAIVQLLYNSINILGVSTTLERAIIGIVILAGVIVDELVRRYAQRRRLAQTA